MLVADNILKNIDQIVERSFIDFTFDLIGDKFLTDEEKIQAESLGLIIGQRPLIELLYILVRQRSEERYQTDTTLQELLTSIASRAMLPITNDQQQFTVDQAKATIDAGIQNTKESIKKKVKQKILEFNQEEKDVTSVEISLPLNTQAERKEKRLNALLASMGVIGVAAASDFSRDFVSNLTDFVNNTTVDSAKQSAGTQDPTKIRVYKRTINDGSLCSWCNSFYNNEDGSPRVFTLSELQRNGTNSGKSKSSWRATVDKTHPRCRCQLNYLSPDQPDPK